MQTTKTCPITNQPFTIRDEDLEFYKKIEVPEPTCHPLERRRQRIAFRNQQHLHKRKCSFTGQLMISQYPPDVRFPVIKNELWYGDEFDPLEYGQDIDWDRPLMDQFYELQCKVPRLCVIQEGEVINSQYTQAAANNKNCYLLFSSNMNEDCLYGTSVVHCKDSVDGYRVLQSELCYECIDVIGCYEVLWGQNSFECNHSALIENCRSCNNCLYCVNLVGKEYHVWNKKVTKEEFKKEWDDFLRLSAKEREARIKKFRSFLPQFPKRFAITKQTENSTGNYLDNCKGAYECFGGQNLEDCAYCFYFKYGGKDCHDLAQFGYNVELSYFSQAVGLNSYFVRFSNLVWESQNITYCDQIFSSKDCWLSVGLKKNQYCVLNKKYTQKEYEELVPKIQKKLEEEGQWGNYFPPKISSYSYNQSWAQEYFPLTKEEALRQGYTWYETADETRYEGPKFEIPEQIEDVPDSIVDQVLTCDATGKNYRIVKPELAFYRKMNLPIPRVCPDERHRQRVELRLPDILHDRTCAECGELMQSVYPQNAPERVLCETCYLKEVQ